MAKKQEKPDRKPFNFGDSPLVKQTEQTVVKGYDRIERGEQGRGEQVADSHKTKKHTVIGVQEITESADAPTKSVRQKEPTRDILVHCPQSLHSRLTMLKMKRWDEIGDRTTINNMVTEAIATWLDIQEKV